MYTRRRQALAGIQSRATGRYVSRRAFGDIIEYPISSTPLSVVRPPSWYRAMQGSSLSGDSLGDDQELTSTGLRRIELVLEKAAAQAERQKWLQIAATLSIPLAAAVWNWILKKRRGGGDTSGIT